MNLNLEYVAKIMTVAIMKRITYGVLQMVHMIGIIVFVSSCTLPASENNTYIIIYFLKCCLYFLGRIKNEKNKSIQMNNFKSELISQDIVENPNYFILLCFIACAHCFVSIYHIIIFYKRQRTHETSKNSKRSLKNK